jgi:hypothetical protein
MVMASMEDTESLVIKDHAIVLSELLEASAALDQFARNLMSFEEVPDPQTGKTVRDAKALISGTLMFKGPELLLLLFSSHYFYVLDSRIVLNRAIHQLHYCKTAASVDVGHLSSLAAKRYEDLLGLEGRSVPKAVSS